MHDCDFSTKQEIYNVIKTHRMHPNLHWCLLDCEAQERGLGVVHALGIETVPWSSQGRLKIEDAYVISFVSLYHALNDLLSLPSGYSQHMKWVVHIDTHFSPH